MCPAASLDAALAPPYLPRSGDQSETGLRVGDLAPGQSAAEILDVVVQFTRRPIGGLRHGKQRLGTTQEVVEVALPSQIDVTGFKEPPTGVAPEGF